jgi:hypothetical protein
MAANPSLAIEMARPATAIIVPKIMMRRCENRVTSGRTKVEVTASVVSSIVPRSPASWVPSPASISAATITGAPAVPR